MQGKYRTVEFSRGANRTQSLCVTRDAEAKPLLNSFRTVGPLLPDGRTLFPEGKHFSPRRGELAPRNVVADAGPSPLRDANPQTIFSAGQEGQTHDGTSRQTEIH